MTAFFTSVTNELFHNFQDQSQKSFVNSLGILVTLQLIIS
jgi:hypothetical protein